MEVIEAGSKLQGVLHNISRALAKAHFSISDRRMNCVNPVHRAPRSRCACSRACQLSRILNSSPDSTNFPTVSLTAKRLFAGGADATRSGVNSVCLAQQCTRVQVAVSSLHSSFGPKLADSAATGASSGSSPRSHAPAAELPASSWASSALTC